MRFKVDLVRIMYRDLRVGPDPDPDPTRIRIRPGPKKFNRPGPGPNFLGLDDLRLIIRTKYDLIFIKSPSKFPEKYTRCASFQINNRIKASCIFRPTLSFKFEKKFWKNQYIFERIKSPGPGPGPKKCNWPGPGPGPKKVGPDDLYQMVVKSCSSIFLLRLKIH